MSSSCVRAQRVSVRACIGAAPAPCTLVCCASIEVGHSLTLSPLPFLHFDATPCMAADERIKQTEVEIEAAKQTLEHEQVIRSNKKGVQLARV